jgi:putative peptidoglycan lipid II flippase
MLRLNPFSAIQGSMSKELVRSTTVVSGMTLLSRVMGFVRDMVLAALFGAGAAMDAFFVAFKIPNFLRRLFAEGAFSQAFVPVLSEYRQQRDVSEVRRLVAEVAGTLFGILFIVTLIGVAVAPALVWLFAPGFVDEPERFGLAAEMLRFTFPYILFISLVALAGGVLNAYGLFAVPAFTPVLLNVCLISVALWLAPTFERPVVALAIGVFIAGAVQLLIQLPAMRRIGLLPMPRWGWRSEGVQRILKLMLPAIFGSSVAQISLLFDTIMASFLVAGSVSWLYFSDRLMEFPLGMFAIALSTVILPSLSRDHAADDKAAFSAKLDWALRLCLLVAVPAAVGLVLLAGPMLSTLFQYGEFDGHDVYMARWSLWAYGFGLLGFSLVKVLVPGYFARQDTRTPVRYGIAALLTNMVLNVAFVVPMVMLGFVAPHAGLALATICGAFVNAGLLFKGLRQQGIYSPQPGWTKFALQLVVSAALMTSFILVAKPQLSWWLEAGLTDRVWWLAGLIGIAAGIYFLSLLLCGLRPRQLLAAKA